jgi:hypothetical protein
MPLSLVQQGLIAQQEFAKLLMMGSDGRIEVASPLTDDERRDFEIHVAWPVRLRPGHPGEEHPQT